MGDDLESFATKAWGQAPWLRSTERGEGVGDLSDLFSPAAVDELVSTRGLRSPFLRMAKDGTTLGDTTFTSGAGAGATISDQVNEDRLLRLFADGATMVLQALHRVWPPLVDFGQQLAADLGHPVQVNAYVTPPQARGFSDHYDVHDVFVVQVQGEKRWYIHEPVHPAPLRDQPWTARRAAVEQSAATDPVLDVVLRPGDCLYLPRGYLHAATALGGVSTHLTIGVHTWHRQHLAQQLTRHALARLADDEQVRASLPLGVDVGDPDELGPEIAWVRERLVEAVRAVPDEQLLGALAALARDQQRPAPLGPLAQLDAAARVSQQSRVAARAHVRPELTTGADGCLLVRSRSGQLTVAAARRAGLERALAGPPVAVAELLDDPAEAVALARDLLRAGLVVPA
ncbi:cupin domain-containing protein [Segeticoccus sp.]|uniref:cupin domain-containing protein n=1 Tax=Segeticoccus sp. TaxID=2706531 RepID=UPI0039C9446F